MLSKAAQDAVKSVQSVGETYSHAHASGMRDTPVTTHQRSPSPVKDQARRGGGYGLEITVAGGVEKNPTPVADEREEEVTGKKTHLVNEFGSWLLGRLDWLIGRCSFDWSTIGWLFDWMNDRLNLLNPFTVF